MRRVMGFLELVDQRLQGTHAPRSRLPSADSLACCVGYHAHALRVICAMGGQQDQPYRLALCDCRTGRMLEVKTPPGSSHLKSGGTDTQRRQMIGQVTRAVRDALARHPSAWNHVIFHGFRWEPRPGTDDAALEAAGGGGGWTSSVALIAFSRAAWAGVEAERADLRGVPDLPMRLAKEFRPHNKCRRY